MTKRKLYWMLLIPTIFIAVITLIYLPEGKKNYSIFIALIYWAIYYILVRILGVKNKNEEIDK